MGNAVVAAACVLAGAAEVSVGIEVLLDFCGMGLLLKRSKAILANTIPITNSKIKIKVRLISSVHKWWRHIAQR